MLGKIFAAPLMILYWAVGLWGFFLILNYLADKIGFIFAFLSLLIAPIVYVVVPLYAGLVDSYWTPALVSYAPVAVYMLVALVGSIFAGRR